MYDGNKNLVAASGLTEMKSNMQYEFVPNHASLVRCYGMLCFATHAYSSASRCLHNHHNLASYRKPGRDSDEKYTKSYGSY